MVICLLIILLLIVVYGYSATLDSFFIIQTFLQVFAGIMMGAVIVYRNSFRRYPILFEFIDWSKVEAAVEEEEKASPQSEKNDTQS